jgi:hypothetical protein
MRFVVLHHVMSPTASHQETRATHWDLMLEQDGVLRTWALACDPLEANASKKKAPTAIEQIIATPLADHRIEYLTFEGPISGDRGSVRRVEAGDYVLIRETDDELIARLAGSQLRGTMHLKCIDRAAQRWTFTLEPDG